MKIKSKVFAQLLSKLNLFNSNIKEKNLTKKPKLKI